MKLSFILFYEVTLLLSLIGAEILFCLFKHSRSVLVEAQKRLQRIAGQELQKNYWLKLSNSFFRKFNYQINA